MILRKVVEVEIECDIENFSDDEIIDEIYNRGLEGGFDYILDDFETNDIISELNDRGYIVQEKIDNNYQMSLDDLYSSYLTMKPEFFIKKLKRFFEERI